PGSAGGRDAGQPHLGAQRTGVAGYPARPGGGFPAPDTNRDGRAAHAPVPEDPGCEPEEVGRATPPVPGAAGRGAAAVLRAAGDGAAPGRRDGRWQRTSSGRPGYASRSNSGRWLSAWPASLPNCWNSGTRSSTPRVDD